MKKVIIDIFLYISSFIPLYFLIIVKELIEIVNKNLSFNVTNSVMLSLNFLLIILGVIGFVFGIKEDYRNVEIINYKNITREDFFPYFPLFVLFAIAFDLQFISMSVVYILILIMVGIVYVKNRLFYINPFLNIIGYMTIEVTFKENDIQKKKKLFTRKSQEGFSSINTFFIK